VAGTIPVPKFGLTQAVTKPGTSITTTITNVGTTPATGCPL
jgi:hypothetical protein